ncbi:MAG TPA: hypothetical protein VFC79_04020, partial [Tissierellaceae bacterium]|nr:hypothetical protein [Tissierellaceae bacterium]
MEETNLEDVLNEENTGLDGSVEINKVYCMDNLELMEQIEDNSVDLIYSDILYNTGKKFRDFDDNLGTT